MHLFDLVKMRSVSRFKYDCLVLALPELEGRRSRPVEPSACIALDSHPMERGGVLESLNMGVFMLLRQIPTEGYISCLIA